MVGLRRDAVVAGPSGVGKSSLLNALSSQSLPAADGMDLSDFACEAEAVLDSDSCAQEAGGAHLDGVSQLSRSAAHTVSHPDDHLKPPKPSEVFHSLWH